MGRKIAEGGQAEIFKWLNQNDNGTTLAQSAKAMAAGDALNPKAGNCNLAALALSIFSLSFRKRKNGLGRIVIALRIYSGRNCSDTARFAFVTLKKSIIKGGRNFDQRVFDVC